MMPTIISTAALLLAAGGSMAAVPSVTITSVPAMGSSDQVSGTTQNVDPNKYGIALIIRVFDTYWTKPYWAQPIMPIGSNGSWSTPYNTGGQDGCADEFIVFVVPLDYPIPLATGGGSIPDGIEQNAIAEAVANRLTGGNAKLTFAGRSFTKKVTGSCIWGPGPNFFNAANSWVDASGKLHLAISAANGVWSCAEIICDDQLGYGTYKVSIDSDLASLPPEAVFGFFTYSDDADYAHREIDFEHSTGDVVGPDNPDQFVVQPYTTPGHLVRFANRSTTRTEVFTWLPGIVSCASYSGTPNLIGGQATYALESAADPGFRVLQNPDLAEISIPAPGNALFSMDRPSFTQSYYRLRLIGFQNNFDVEPVRRAMFTDAVPPAGTEKLHINLWLFNGQPPSDNANHQVVISNIEFIPMVRALQPRVELATAPDKQLQFRARLR